MNALMKHLEDEDEGDEGVNLRIPPPGDSFSALLSSMIPGEMRGEMKGEMKGEMRENEKKEEIDPNAQPEFR